MANGLLAYLASPTSPNGSLGPAPPVTSDTQINAGNMQTVLAWVRNYYIANPSKNPGYNVAVLTAPPAQLQDVKNLFDEAYLDWGGQLNTGGYRINPSTGTIQGPGNPGAQGTINKFTSWEQALEDFVAKITSGAFWQRVGEFAAGGLLLGIGVHAMLHSNPTYQRTVSRPLTRAVKGAGLVTEVRHARSVNNARRTATRTNAEARVISANANKAKAVARSKT